jgi:hypothetical protein
VKRWAVLVLGAVTAIAAGMVLPPARGSVPGITYTDRVPDDLRLLAGSTWDRFIQSFPARRDCINPVVVDGAPDLDDRATYDPGVQLVTVRVPGTAHNLEASLLHEFAHHLEFTCDAHRGLRSSFLRAQGSARDTPWFQGATWESIPSEQFAEAATEFVLGDRPGHARIDVSRDTMSVIRRWATD